MGAETSSLSAALRWFACPACRGVLGTAGEAVVCGACGRRYPVEDGIPVLLQERAWTEDRLPEDDVEPGCLRT